MKPEEKVEIILWDWIYMKGVNTKMIYFNRKNKLEQPTFQTRGVNKKPDFIIQIDRGYGIEYAAVEIKSSKQSKNILDASKILDVYYKNYTNNKTHYFINEKEIELKFFLVASESSIKGFLFSDEKVEDNLKSKNKSKITVTKMNLIPRYEGTQTHQFVRTLWNALNRMNNQKKCSLGIIIANKEDENKPYMMIKHYIDFLGYLNRKPSWGQRFLAM